MLAEKFMQELCSPDLPETHLRIVKIDGTKNPADAFTKHLAKPGFRKCMACVYNVNEHDL